MNITIDDEWEQFMNPTFKDCSDDSDNELNFNIEENNEIFAANISNDLILDSAPKSSDIYISTKTKIAYLDRPIDLKKIFWNIDVIPYARPVCGVVKKQMKFNSTNIEEVQEIHNKLKELSFYEDHVITSINNPSGRIKFKDIRKISIGISKKDIVSYRCKRKSAFYNCFVVIIRLKIDDEFKEFHVKVFNTGKLEIPGIQTEESLQIILASIIEIIQPHMEEKLGYKENSTETVLINSNFNCGYYINRELLYELLKTKYNIQAIYDPCSYPGIQCKFYFNPDIGIQNDSQITQDVKSKFDNIKEVSFMIFRTGSVLIVGKCDESVLITIYEFLKNILATEYKEICQKNIKNELQNDYKDKSKKKLRRKHIIMIDA
jgi:TATA-box binding protein (TBP) (component of TFIID and TFIIIB)